MNVPMSDLNNQERAIFALRALYRSYGYTQFKMSKFEEYDLYARNKDFLLSDGIITFTDTDGKLLALKPDVTLSIIKNSRDTARTVQKLYYNENVYRVSGGTHSFKEIMQVGLECIGDVDRFCISEVLTLAAESLARIAEDAVLNVSHLGILSAVLDAMEISEDTRAELLRCVGEKNRHELSAIGDTAGVARDRLDALATLLSIYGTPTEALERLDALASTVPAIAAPLEEFRAILAPLTAHPQASILRVDFSVTGNTKYYNGIVFCGFVGGCPTRILSGGQYDRLMQRMKKSASAIGFAVYLDLLELLPREENAYDADAFLLYTEGCDTGALTRARATLAADGRSVAVGRTLPTDGRYRAVYQFDGNEVKELEANA